MTLLRPLALTLISSLLLACGAEPSLETPADESAEIELATLEPEAAEPRGFFFVIDAAGPLVVIDRDPEPSWATGPTELVQTGSPWTVTRRGASPVHLPEELSGLAGRHVRLYGERGEVCTAELSEPELVRRSDAFELEELADPTEHKSLAERAWEASSSRLVLGSRVRPLDGECRTASFATFADDEPPLLFAPKPSPRFEPGLRDAALAAFRQLPAWQGIQDGYEGDGVWEEHGGAEPQTFVWTANERTLIGVEASVGDFCGDFSASLFALFEASGSKLELRVSDQQGGAFPSQLFDIGRDGRLEMLSGERLWVANGSGVVSFDVEVPSYGCPC